MEFKMLIVPGQIQLKVLFSKLRKVTRRTNRIWNCIDINKYCICKGKSSRNPTVITDYIVENVRKQSSNKSVKLYVDITPLHLAITHCSLIPRVGLGGTYFRLITFNNFTRVNLCPQRLFFPCHGKIPFFSMTYLQEALP